MASLDAGWVPRRFASNRAGTTWDLYWKEADGTGEADLLFAQERTQIPRAWSPDGQNLAFTWSDPAKFDIWFLTVANGAGPRPWLQTSVVQPDPVFSPHGRWIAYTSAESGRSEVYVRPVSGTGGKWRVSTDGGEEPLGSPTGRELFYRSGDQMLVVDVVSEAGFEAGKPRRLFEGDYIRTGIGRAYDVTPDGQRFVMIRPAAALSGPTHLSVVVNWFEELKALVPIN